MNDPLIISGASLTDVLFTHFDPVTKAELNFNVTRIANSPRTKLIEPIPVTIDRKFAASLPKLRGLEKHRVMRLLEGLRQGAPCEPILMASMPDDTHLIIDGSHRYYVAALLNWHAIPTKVIPRTLWKKYIVNMPPARSEEDVVNSFSGIA